jgi:hypothetical protein
MTRRRIFGLALGVLLMVGFGAISLSRAQQTGSPKADGGPSHRPDTAQIAALEAEVELLQLEHDVARAQLKQLLENRYHLELLRETDVLTPAGMADELSKMITGIAPPEIKMSVNLMELAKTSDDELAATQKKIDDAATPMLNKTLDAFRAAFDRRRKDFVEKSKQLNQKKRELADAQKPHQAEVR